MKETGPWLDRDHGRQDYIARLPMAWKDPAYRAAARNGTTIARLIPAEGAARPTAQPLRRRPHQEFDARTGPVDIGPFPIATGPAGRYPWND